MQFVSTRVGRVAYESTGHGPPLVLLHSGGHDHHDFDAIVPRLAARYRTLAVDLPGHGDSDSLREHTRAALLCEAVEDLFDALALRDAALVGNSVGGMAALRVALRWPERVRGLVLASTSGLVQQSALLRALCWVQGRELVRRWTGRAFTRAYLRARNEHVAALLARQEAAHARPDFLPMEAALWRSFAEPACDLSGRVGALACPALLVWGRHDPVLRARVEGARARALLPHAQWHEMDTGHAPFVEDPEGFLAVTDPFLDGLSAGPAWRDDAAAATGARA